MNKNVFFSYVFIFMMLITNCVSAQPCDGLALTQKLFSESDNLNLIVVENLGNSFSAADWRDLEAIKNINEWIHCMGLEKDQTFLINLDEKSNSGGRYYYVHFSPTGKPYSGFLVHSQIDNKLFLGSWYGLSMPILLKIKTLEKSNKSIQLTANFYSEKNDILSKIQNEFGSYAKLADWSQIKDDIKDDGSQFCNETGLKNNENAMVSWNGQRFWTGTKRQFFITRFDDGPESGYLVHDRKGKLYLGSWYDLNMKCVVVLNSNHASNNINDSGNDFEGYYSNSTSHLKVVKHNGKYFASSNMFEDELELHNSETNKKTDFFVEFMAGDGLTSISISFGKEPNGDHYLLFAFDVADNANLMRRNDAKLPQNISEWFIKQDWENPCTGLTQPIMMDFYDINRDGSSDYIYWEVGCPDTRGRGETLVFDGKSGSLLFHWFGYEITGGYARKDIIKLYSKRNK